MRNQYPTTPLLANLRRESSRTSMNKSPAAALPHGPNPGGMPARRIPFLERPTCTIAEACDAIGLGRTKLYELIGGGDIDTITIGRRRLVRVASLLKLLKIDSV